MTEPRLSKPRHNDPWGWDVKHYSTVDALFFMLEAFLAGALAEHLFQWVGP